MSDDPQQRTAPPPAPTQRQSVVNSFVSIVRALGIPGVDVQKMSMAFGMSIDSLEPGQPVELESLFTFLVKELKAPEKQVLELCAVLKSRESKLGVTFESPMKIRALTPEQLEKITREANAKVASALGWEKTGEITIPPPSKSTGKTTPGQKAWRPDGSKKGDAKPRSMTPIYAGVLVVTIIGAVSFFAWRQATSLPPIHDIPLPIDNPLKCTKLVTMNGKTVICEIPRATFTTLGEDSTAKFAAMTKKSLGSGVDTFMVRLIEDGKIVAMK